jgi:protein-disulfide isomerase
MKVYESPMRVHIMKPLLSLVPLAATTTLLACSPQPGRSDLSGGDVAARIGDRVVTTRELDDRWRAMDPPKHDLALEAVYNGRRAALDDIVATALIAAAAKASNLDEEAFTAAELARRVARVSDDEIAMFYERNRRQMRDRSLEQMTATIRAYLTDERRQRARHELVSDLQKNGPPVRTMFGPPRHDIRVTRADPAAGPSSAPVTIVEFSDFQCPFCQRVSPVLKQVRDAYGDKVRVVWKDFPLTQIHPLAFRAAEAAHCAGEQGDYWDYHDQLFASQQALASADLTNMAEQVGLDVPRFEECLDTSRYADRVHAGIADATKLGITSTPTIFINGRRLSGAQPFEALASVIDEELSRN